MTVKLAFKFESRDNVRGNLSNTETALNYTTAQEELEKMLGLKNHRRK